MAAIVRVKNSAGYTQIDHEFKNPALVYKGTATTDTALGSGTSQVTVTLPAGLIRPLIAYSCDAPLLIIQSSNTFAAFICKAAVGKTFTYYVFDDPPNTAPTGPRMVLKIPTGYPGAGEIAFRSDMKYLKILQKISASAASFMDVGTVAGSSTFSGKTLAVIQSAPGVRQRATSNVGGQGGVPCATFSGGAYISNAPSVLVESFIAFTFVGSLGFDSLGMDGVWLVIDVTNY